MNNQNTNGLNEVNGDRQNVNPTSTFNPELQNIIPTTPFGGGEENGVISNNNIGGQQSFERPTLDSILNGENGSPVISNNTKINTPSSIGNTPETLEEPVVDQSAMFGSNPYPTTPTSMNSQSNSTNIQTTVNGPSVDPYMNANHGINNGMISPTNNSINTSIGQNQEISSPSFTGSVLSENENIQVDSSMKSINTSSNSVETSSTVFPTEPQNPVNPIPPQDIFNEVPIPPLFEDGKNKKNKNKEGDKKVIIVILLLILIAAIGFGVYYFLRIAKNNATSVAIVTKDLKLEVGSTISNDIADFATISGYDKNNCTLDLGNIDLNRVSTYKYTVTCGKTSQEGTIIVDDTIAPKVITNDLILLPNATLKAEDFIEKCVDTSTCSFKFAEDVSNLTSKIGEYEVKIIASDNYNNETTVTAKLTVARNAPVKYLSCTSATQPFENTSMTHTYRIGLDAKSSFLNATKKTTFVYNTLEEYQTSVSGFDKSVGINGIIGTETFNENEKSIVIQSSKTLAEMNQDLNGTLPSEENAMRAYLSLFGYTCN